MSLMERLMSKWKLYSKESKEGSYNSKFITKLRLNFRSHKQILDLPNKMFYDGELIVSILHTLWLRLLSQCKCLTNFASGKLQIMFFWDVIPSTLVDMYQRLGEVLLPYTSSLKLDAPGSPKHWYLRTKLRCHIPDGHILIVTPVRTSDLTCLVCTGNHPIMFCIKVDADGNFKEELCRKWIMKIMYDCTPVWGTHIYKIYCLW
jgi:hypothetical protein